MLRTIPRPGDTKSPTRSDRLVRVSVAIEYLSLFLLAGVFLQRGFLPGWRSLNTDFPDYYLAARLYHQGYPLEQIYDWTWTQRQKDHIGIDQPIVGFAVLTPFSLLPVLPFASLSPLEAKRAWLLVNLAFLGLTAWLLHRMSTLGLRRVSIIIFLAMVPLRTNFLFGQEYVLLLLLLTGAAWLYLRNKRVAAGVVLAIAAALKIYPGLFVLFFARKKQWRSAVSLVAGSVACWAISVALFGVETVRIYLEEVLPWPLRAEGQDPYNVTWNSFSALLHRLFVAEPDLNPHPLIHAPTAYAILQPICQVLIFVPLVWLMRPSCGDAPSEKLEWGAFIAMLLMLSTNPASYDFAALILVAVFAVGYLMATDRQWQAVGTLILYALVSYPTYRWVPHVITGWRVFLAFPRLWSMALLWIALLAVLWQATPSCERARLKWPGAAIFCGLSLCLLALGTVVNLLHLRNEFDNYGSRMMSAPNVLLATDPVIAGDKALFTAMSLNGYVTGEFAKSDPRLLDFAADSFHPAGGPALPWGWVEVTGTRSNVIRFPLDAAVRPLGQEVVEAEDAEKPAVSPDGRWLAFIRETQGRGALWLRQLEPARPGHHNTAAERRLSPADLDVLDIGFDSRDSIIFSARRGRQPRLFTVGPESGAVTGQVSRSPRRYPAASPDGRWLAFSQREGSSWQVWVEDLATHSDRQLTHSDCNSIAPAWYPDSRHLVYASDCARGYGMTALCRIQAIP